MFASEVRLLELQEVLTQHIVLHLHGVLSKQVNLVDAFADEPAENGVDGPGVGGL